MVERDEGADGPTRLELLMLLGNLHEENDRLREALARVEALCGEADVRYEGYEGYEGQTGLVPVDAIRAALQR